MKQQPLKLEKINYFIAMQRGISEEKAISLIVNGYAKEVLNKVANGICS
jgi:Fe-S cluster assembly protein SufB